MRKRGYDPLAVKFQMKNRLANILFSLGAATALHAAPKLRLTTTSVGPVPVAQGENAVIKSTQHPCARNAGGCSGSFAFTRSDTVTANATGLAAGDYNGSVAILGSSLAADNRAVPVVLHVTAQPLAQPTSESVQFQIAKGAAKQNADVSLVNAGQGGQSALTVSRATTAASWGGNWLSAASSGTYIKLTADPSTLV